MKSSAWDVKCRGCFSNGFVSKLFIADWLLKTFWRFGESCCSSSGIFFASIIFSSGPGARCVHFGIVEITAHAKLSGEELFVSFKSAISSSANSIATLWISSRLLTCLSTRDDEFSWSTNVVTFFVLISSVSIGVGVAGAETEGFGILRWGATGGWGSVFRAALPITLRGLGVGAILPVSAREQN